jgi:VWFA-related protein
MTLSRDLLAVALTATSVGAQTQAPPERRAPQATGTPSFPAGTELVTVDAVVQDKKGEPILGLTAADFTIKEDGVIQGVQAFEAVDRPAQVPPSGTAVPVARRTSSNVDAAARVARSFVFVFDERHLDPAEAQRGRVALTRFLETGVGAGDRVTLVGTRAGVAWTARLPEGHEGLLQVLNQLQGRRSGEFVRDAISDYEALRIDRDSDPIVIDRVARRFVATGGIHRDARLPGDPPDRGENLDSERGLVRARAAEVYSRVATDNETTLALIERSLDGLAAVRGRKSMILVSGGFVHDPHLGSFRRVVTAARRANAALYFIDARGLSGAPSAVQADSGVPTDFNDLGSTLEESREQSEGSESLAADTGGFSVRDNDLLGGLERIGRESTSYYLLGYKPAEVRADGRFRKIEVTVGREGARVRARRGYYAPDAADKTRRVEAGDAALQRAVNSPFELADVPLRATTHVFGEAAPGKSAVLLTAEADIRGVAFATRGGTAKDTLELLLVVTNRESAEFYRFDQQFEMSFRAETRARYEATWFPITRKLELVPGSYQAKIIVRDHNAGRLGSLTHDFDVAAPDGLRLSTPILSDRVREETPGARVPEPIARRTFAPSGVLHCHFEVYGAATDPKTGEPDVTAGFAIRRSDGRFLTAMPETPLRAGPDGSLARTFGTPLEGAPPGRYEMIVLVTDVAAGRATEAREPFVIEEPGDN